MGTSSLTCGRHLYRMVLYSETLRTSLLELHQYFGCSLADIFFLGCNYEDQFLLRYQTVRSGREVSTFLSKNEIKWNANLMQLGNFIDVFLARHVSGTYAHHQEY